MSRTHKIQKAYKAYKAIPPDNNINEHVFEIQTSGVRYGNQRKMRSKMKVDERKSRRAKEKRDLKRSEEYE